MDIIKNGKVKFIPSKEKTNIIQTDNGIFFNYLGNLNSSNKYLKLILIRENTEHNIDGEYVIDRYNNIEKFTDLSGIGLGSEIFPTVLASYPIINNIPVLSEKFIIYCIDHINILDYSVFEFNNLIKYNLIII